MSIPIPQAIAQMQEADRRRRGGGGPLTGKIIAVNYVARRLQVQVSGHANIRRVRVADNVSLGTVYKKLVYPGDYARLEKDSRTGKWICTAIIHKIKCPPGTVVGDGVEVDVAYETSNSNITGNYGLTVTPETPFMPEVGILGQISLPTELSFSTYDVGGGYPGSFTGPLAQNIGLVNGNLWGKYFVIMTGTANWEMVLNGTTIASGSGTDSGTLSAAFADFSTFTFQITSGSGSDLFYGIGA